MNTLHGVIVALPLPLQEDGRLALNVIRRHVDAALDAGVKGFWVNGATGCCIYQNKEQRKQTLEGVFEAVRGRAKVLAMVSALNLQDGIELAEHAGRLGIDGISAMPPLLYPTKVPFIIDYLRRLKDAAGLGITYYHVAGLTRVSLEAAQLVEMCRRVPLEGVKFSDLDTYKACEIKLSCPDVAIMSGMEEILLGGMALNCFDGTVGASQNFMPGPYVEIYNRYNEGDLAGAQKVLPGVTKVVAVQSMFDFTASTFAIMNLLGFEYGRPIAPMPYLDDEEIDTLKTELLKVIRPDPLKEKRLISTEDFLP